MLITMLTSDCFSDDGFTVKRPGRGWSGEVADMAARRLIREGRAVEGAHVISPIVHRGSFLTPKFKGVRA